MDVMHPSALPAPGATRVVRSRLPTAVGVALRVELWPALATLTLTLALLDGFGALDNIYVVKPRPYAIAMTVLLLTTILFTPRGLIRTVRFPKPLVLLCTWIVMSYAWTGYHGGFIKETWKTLATILVVVVVGQLFPIDRFLRALLVAGFVELGLVAFTIVAMHGRAFTSEGLRGSFIHKSEMGSALIVMVAVALCLDVSPRLRRALLGVVMLALLVGRTTTGVASILLVLGLYVPLVRYQALRRRLGRSFGTLMAGSVLAFGALYFFASNALVSLYGKDLTFSNRTAIWQGVVTAIGHRPLTGYGWTVWQALWLDPASSIIKTAGFAVAESHNAALELLLRLGVVGLVLFLVLMFDALRTGLRLTAGGDRSGVFTVLFVAIVVIWGFSEALPMTGVWIGMLGVLAVRRPMPGSASPVHAVSGSRRRMLAPRVAHGA